MPDRDFGSDDNWYDYLTGVKDANAQRVRNSVQEPSSGGRNAIVSPTPEEPSKVESFKEAKERQAETKAIAEENVLSKENWDEWQFNTQSMPYILGAIAYFYFNK